MNKVKQYSPETRERAVRLVFEQEREYGSQWATIRSISEKVGCTPEPLRTWIRQDERDSGRCAGLTTDERQRLKRANEILRKESAYFAQAELDREGIRFARPPSSSSGRPF